jgi:hypothetical protein
MAFISGGAFFTGTNPDGSALGSGAFPSGSQGFSGLSLEAQQQFVLLHEFWHYVGRLPGHDTGEQAAEANEWILQTCF